MKFKTLRTSVTGKKFDEIIVKRDEAINAVEVLVKELGIKEWRPDWWAVYGGISYVGFEGDKNPDPKVWKETEHGLNPRLNTKVGKKIQAKFDELPTVSRRELNECVGFNNAFSHIGFNSTNPKWYLFSTNDGWDFTPPEDCIEITVTEYKKLGDAN